MNTSLSFKSKVLSCASFLPQQVVTSSEIFEEFHSEKDYGIPKNWMSKNMGIVERRMCSIDTQPSDLAIEAAKKALLNFSGQIGEIDLVLFCGIERDHAEPATAHTIQQKLGINANYAFDVANACYGFTDGLRIATNFVESGIVRYALVTTGEVPTKLTRNFIEQLKKGMTKQQAKKILGFLSVGDAGGAVIVGRSESASGFNVFECRTNSNHVDKCFYNHANNGDIVGQMLMPQIVAHTLKLQQDVFLETSKKAGWDKFDFLLTHQVGKRTFDEIAKFGVVKEDRIVKTYDKLGNITSASLPVTFAKLFDDPRLKKGSKIYGSFSGSGIVVGQFTYVH